MFVLGGPLVLSTRGGRGRLHLLRWVTVPGVVVVASPGVPGQAVHVPPPAQAGVRRAGGRVGVGGARRRRGEQPRSDPLVDLLARLQHEGREQAREECWANIQHSWKYILLYFCFYVVFCIILMSRISKDMSQPSLSVHPISIYLCYGIFQSAVHWLQDVGVAWKFANVSKTIW